MLQKAKSAGNMLLSMGMFRILCLVYTVLNLVPTETQPLNPYMKLFHIYALAVVLWDLFTSQRALRNKGRICLALFLLGSIVTYLCNPNLLNASGISNYLYLLWFLLIVYSYDPASDREMQWFNRVGVVLITAMNLVGIWMFFEKYIYYMPNGHIGMYPHENRLCGLFRNPNVLAAVSFIAMALGALLLNKGRKGDKVLGAIALAVNFTTLTMAKPRAYMFGISVAVGVYVFAVLWERRKKFWVRAGLALLAAVTALTVCLLAQRLILVAEQAVDGVKDYFVSLESPSTGDGQGDQPSDPTGSSLIPTDGDGQGDQPSDPTGSSLIPTDGDGQGDQPSDPTGSSLIPTDGDGQGDQPSDPTGSSLIPPDPTLGTKPVSGDVFGRAPTTKLNGRMDLWRQGLAMIAGNWLVGVGLDNHQVAAGKIGQTFAHSYGGLLHNAYLDFLLAFGVVGLLVLCAFCLLVAGNLRKFFKYCKDRDARHRVMILLSLLSCFAVTALSDSSVIFSMYAIALAWWTLLAQMMQIVECELKKTVHYRPDLAGTVWDAIFKKKRNGYKICFAVDSLGGGGAERVLLDVTRGLSQKGLDITVLTLRSGGELEEKLAPGVKLHSIDPFDTLFFKRVLHWLNRHHMPRRVYNFLFLDGRYRHTVAFLEGLSTVLVADTKLQSQDKRLAWVHCDFSLENWGQPYFGSKENQRKAYERFDRIYCVSEHTREAFAETVGCADRTETLYSLMDAPRITALGQEACPEEKPEGLLLCAIGRLHEQKGFDRLIPVVGRLREKGLPVTLWILGEGAKRPELEAQIAQLGLENCVRLLGFQENPYCFAAQADVFVLSSRTEGFGLVVTENLLLGKPVVATDCAGIREQLGEDEYGIVTDNTEEALLAGLERMLMDEGLRAHYAQKAQEKAAGLSYEKQVQQFVDIFS